MASPDASVWQSSELARTYLDNVRGGIPLGAEQLDVMRRLVAAAVGPPARFLDLGCGSGALAAVLLQMSPDAEGLLLDFSETMLEEARESLSGRGDLRFLCVDYGDPEWVDAVAGRAPSTARFTAFSAPAASS